MIGIPPNNVAAISFQSILSSYSSLPIATVITASSAIISMIHQGSQHVARAVKNAVKAPKVKC